MTRPPLTAATASGLRADLAYLPACLLFLGCTAFMAGYATLRSTPVDASTLLVVLLPLLLVGGVPRARLCDGLAERFLLVAGAWLAWMLVVEAVRGGTPTSAWWRFAEHAAALALCVAIVARRPTADGLLRHAGAAAACAVAIAVTANAGNGMLRHLETACFGFGHVNVLTNTAGPALLAWLTLTALRWRAGRRPDTRDLVLLGVGVGLLALLTVVTGRRGVVAGWGVAGLWFCWSWLRARRRLLADGLLVVVLLAGAAALWRLSTLTVAVGRSERVDIYRAAWDGVRASWPWGYGFYGAMQVQVAPGEHARHVTAAGGRGTHAHNELLDTLLDGGPVALLLVLVLLGLLAWRVRRMADPVHRAAFTAMGLAMAVHMLTDNCYGTTLGLAWCGVVAGMILAAPTAGGPRPLAWLPSLRAMMWPLVLVSAWGATRTIYPAVLHKDAGMASRFQCLLQALEPQTVDLHGYRLLFDVPGALNDFDQRVVIDEVVRKNGWSGPLAVCEAQWQMRAGAPAQRVSAILRLLGFTAFDKGAYENLALTLRAAPQCTALVPAAVQRRLAYLAAAPGLPAPDLTLPPADIDAAADLYAATIWAIARGRPWAEVRAPLEHLVARYGNIPGIAQLALESVAAAPPGTFPGLPAQRANLLLGIRFCQGPLGEVLERANTAADGGRQARALWPLLAALWPEIADDCARGGIAPGQADDDESVRVRALAVRIWGRARADSGAGEPRPAAP